MPRHSGQIGAKNPQWKGGRVIASNGYVLLRMPGHHLADVRGYVYEHRLVAEQKLGRRLAPGEIPHHVNGIKMDNRPENLIEARAMAAELLALRALVSQLSNVSLIPITALELRP